MGFALAACHSGKAADLRQDTPVLSLVFGAPNERLVVAVGLEQLRPYALQRVRQPV